MSFIGDLGNSLHKIVDDASNALFGNQTASPQQPQSPQQVQQPHPIAIQPAAPLNVASLNINQTPAQAGPLPVAKAPTQPTLSVHPNLSNILATAPGPQQQFKMPDQMAQPATPNLKFSAPSPSQPPIPVTTATTPNFTGPSAQTDDYSKPPTIDTRARTIEQGIKQNLPLDTISDQTGLSKDELIKYTNDIHPGYAAQTPIEAVGSFVGDLANNAAGIVRKPLTSALLMNDPNTQNAITSAVMAQDQAYKRGQISLAKLQDSVHNLTQDNINNPYYVDQNGVHVGDEGYVSKQALLGGFQQGVDTAGVLPTGNIIKGAQAVGDVTTDLVKALIAHNGSQSLVYGTANTANDIAQGRGVTPQSLLANYGTPFVLGTTSEAAGLLGKEVRGAIRDAQGGPESERGAAQVPGGRAPDAPIDPEVARVADNVQKNNPNTRRVDAEAIAKDIVAGRGPNQTAPQLPKTLNPEEEANKYSSVQDYLNQHSTGATTPEELLHGPTNEPLNHDVLNILRQREAQAPQLPQDKGRLQEFETIGKNGQPVKGQIYINRNPSSRNIKIIRDKEQAEIQKMIKINSNKEFTSPSGVRYSTDADGTLHKVSLPKEQLQQNQPKTLPVEQLGISKTTKSENRSTYDSNTPTAEDMQAQAKQFGDKTPLVMPKDNISAYDVMNYQKNGVIPPKIAKFKEAEDAAIPLLQSGNTGDAIKLYAKTAETSLKEAGNNVFTLSKHLGVEIPDDTNIPRGYEPENNPQLQSIKTLLSAPSKDYRDAAMKAQTASDMLTDAANEALGEGKKLSAHDRDLLRDTETIDDARLVSKAENPDQFAKVLDAMRDYYDTRHALGNIAEQKTAYVPQYTPHYYNLKTPEAEAAYEAYKAHLIRNPSYTKGRTFDSYDKAKAFGLQPKYGSALHDLLNDYNKAAPSIKGAIFADELDTAYPGKVSVGELPTDEDGSIYKQIQLFGNQGNRLSMPKEIADQVNKLSWNTATPAETAFGKTVQALGKGYDFANRTSKQFLLSGGLFHLLNTGLYAMTKPIALIKHILNTDDTHTVQQQQIRRLAGLTTGSHDLEGDFQSGNTKAPTLAERNKQYDDAINKALQKPGLLKQLGSNTKKVLNISHAITFEGGIKNFKEGIFDDITKGLDPANVKDLTEMRRVAKVLNDFYGGQNRLMKGTWSPKVFSILSRILLAPDFLEGQARSIGHAAAGAGKIFIGKSDRADRLAVQTLAGRIIMVGGAVTVYNALTNPQNQPTDGVTLFKNFLGNLLDPEIQTGIKSASGTPQTIATPNTFLNVIAKAVEPLFNGDPNKLSGVEHELVARTAAGARMITSLATNQDYYGNPVIVPGDTKKTALNLASQLGPIPVSSAISSTKSGTQPVDWTKSVISVLGGRLHNDPNSPQAQASNFKYTQFNGLNPAVQTGIEKVLPSMTPGITPEQLQAAYKDPSFELSKWIAYQDPKVQSYLRAVDAKDRSLGMPGNPIFDLSKDQMNTLITYEVQHNADPGNTAGNAQKILNDNPFINNYFNKLSDYYTAQNKQYQSTNGSQGTPIQVGPVARPVVSQATQGLLTQLGSLTDSTDKANFLKAHPDLNTYFQNQDDYYGRVREAMKLPQLRQYPQADPATSTFMTNYFAANKTTRTALRNSNPNDYLSMQNYMANADRYGLDQAAGLDSLIGKNETQTSAPSQKYEKNAFNLGQYDIAKGTDANGKTAFQWFPSTNTAAGSTANVSPLIKITQGGSGFKGIDGYKGPFGSGGSSNKKSRKARIIIRRPKVRFHKIHTSRRIHITAPKVAKPRITIDRTKKVGTIKIV